MVVACGVGEKFTQSTEESDARDTTGLSAGVHDLSGLNTFTLSDNTVSILLSVFNSSGEVAGVLSLTDPNGDNLLNQSPLSTYRIATNGFGNILIPISPDHSVSSGTWSFGTLNATSVQLTVRKLSAGSETLTVRPFLTGTQYSASDLATALSAMETIYENAGISMEVESVTVLSNSAYSEVTADFTNSTTAAMISEGDAFKANLFFVEDFTGDNAGLLGIAAGIPGSLGIDGAFNGVMIGLNGHVSGGSLLDQLLGETAAHELGHWLGLFHTTEADGSSFDPLDDTPTCPTSFDSDSDGIVSIAECLERDATNLMFWAGDSAVSQTQLTSEQRHVLSRTPLGQ